MVGQFCKSSIRMSITYVVGRRRTRTLDSTLHPPSAISSIVPSSSSSTTMVNVFLSILTEEETEVSEDQVTS
jgi:hypothetical protein